MFLDTSGLMCLLDHRDHRHVKALEFYRPARIRIISSYVLAEYVALAQVRGMPRRQTLEFSAEILEDKTVEIVWVTESLHLRALQLLRARQDKTYSLCDAVSFVLMRDYGIHEALTTDRHFEQEGFTRLLEG
ncbi:MAG: PIN domain-containing protein [Blastocatellia bacterium]